MTCNLAVHSGAWPDMTWPIGARPAVAALMGRAAAAISRIAGTHPRGFLSRGAGCDWTMGIFAKRASRFASNGNEDGLPCRGISWLIAVPYMCGGLARERDLRWIARRYDIAGAPAHSVS